MNSLLFDWDSDALQRKYSQTYCIFERDKKQEIFYVSEVANMSSDSPSLVYLHVPYRGGDGRWMDGSGVHAGAMHEQSSNSLKVHGTSVPVGHLQGLASKAKYFVDKNNALYFGGRKMRKTFKWGIDKENWFISRAANATNYTLPKILEFVMSAFSRKEHASYQLLSEEVAVCGGVIKILNVTVGFLDGTQAKVKNAAVGKILSELEPSWTISYW